MAPHLRRFSPCGPIDLRSTLSPLVRGWGDPAARLGPRGFAWATRTPDGPATLWLEAEGPLLVGSAWGAGADRILEGLPGLVGAGDNDSGFVSHHPVVHRLRRRLPGLRIGRTGAVVEALVPTILEQKVTGREAHAAYRRLVLNHGEPAPGPLGLTLPPAPETLAALPYHAYHPLGIERRRACAIKVACSYARRLEELGRMPLADAYRRLQALPGVGPWTAAEVARVALGDADAVSVGDFHLPHLVTWMLAGERRGDDDRMLELLEPYRGQRARVIRLLEVGGSPPQARAPRAALRSIRFI